MSAHEAIREGNPRHIAPSEFQTIREAIISAPENAWAADLGYRPLYSAGPRAKVAVIGQAPGRRAQESGIAWNDASGKTLMSWLGVTEQQFRDPSLFALLPMDFYYPGKGTSGDLPPRRGFADRWHVPLRAAMPEIRLTILIGTYAQQHYLPGRTKRNLTETVYAFRDYMPSFFPLVHPSPLNFRWQARNRWFEADVIPALQEAVAGAIR